MDNLVSQEHCIEGQHVTTIKLQLVQKHKKYVGNMVDIILKYFKIMLHENQFVKYKLFNHVCVYSPHLNHISADSRYKIWIVTQNRAN